MRRSLLAVHFFGLLALGVTVSDSLQAQTLSINLTGYKGDWNSATKYAKGNIVTYNNQTFLALQSGNKDRRPGADTQQYWQLIGSNVAGPKGDKGDTGSQGPIGPKGEAGTMQTGTILGDMLYWDGAKWVEVTPPSANSLSYYGTTMTLCGGVPAWGPCKSGPLTFGLNQYLSGTDPNLPQGNSPRTIEAWIKTTTLPSSNGWNTGSIVEWGDLVGYKRCAMLMGSSGGAYYNDLAGGIWGSLPFTDGVWRKATITHDGSVVNIYRNGQLDYGNSTAFYNSSPFASDNTTGTGLRIGLSSQGEQFIGEIRAVTVYNRVLSQPEINNMDLPVGTETGLVSFYDMAHADLAGKKVCNKVTPATCLNMVGF